MTRGTLVLVVLCNLRGLSLEGVKIYAKMGKHRVLKTVQDVTSKLVVYHKHAIN